MILLRIYHRFLLKVEIRRKVSLYESLPDTSMDKLNLGMDIVRTQRALESIS